MSDSAKAKNLEFSSDSKFGEGKKNVKKKWEKMQKKKKCTWILQASLKEKKIKRFYENCMSKAHKKFKYRNH